MALKKTHWIIEPLYDFSVEEIASMITQVCMDYSNSNKFIERIQADAEDNTLEFWVAETI